MAVAQTKGALVSGNMDQHLQNFFWLILSHTQMFPVCFETDLETLGGFTENGGERDLSLSLMGLSHNRGTPENGLI